MMRFIFSALLLVFSCNKFDPPAEYDRLIGTWENLKGDEKVLLIFHKNGKIEEKHDLLRSTRLKSKGCTYDSDRRLFYFESDTYGVNYHVYSNPDFDTLSVFQASFNQPDSSLSIAIEFIKIKE